MTRGRSSRGALSRRLIVIAVVGGGCQAAPSNMAAVESYYSYDFSGAREALRADSYTQNDEQTILNNLRLGMAALADGDLEEAERALGTVFEMLGTAGLNRDRTTAAVLTHEGVRIWKGEPFEQALAYHYIAVLYALLGQYDNVQAAAANSLFRLTDFGADQNAETIVRRAAEDEGHLEHGYRAVDTNFALGFLMQAIGGRSSGLSGWEGRLDAAAAIDASLADIAGTIKRGECDTLLIVDYGTGPRKVAYGPDEALVRFVEVGGSPGGLVVSDRGGSVLARAPLACDVNAMALDHRWNNLEDLRRAKSAIGHVLMAGGTWVAWNGAQHDSGGTALAGAGMIVAGLLTRAGARADTRYVEFVPQAIYVAPLHLAGGPADLTVSIEGDPDATMTLLDVEPGSERQPRTIYVRLHGGGRLPPEWLVADRNIYTNDHTGAGPGERPWILGGRDVSTPSRAALEAYQAGGWLTGLTVRDLQDLYRAEGILIGSGRENRPGELRNPSYRHILEGGTGLFTPHPLSMGYKRLMASVHPPYEPKSDAVRRLAGCASGQGDPQATALTHQSSTSRGKAPR